MYICCPLCLYCKPSSLTFCCGTRQWLTAAHALPVPMLYTCNAAPCPSALATALLNFWVSSIRSALEVQTGDSLVWFCLVKNDVCAVRWRYGEHFQFTLRVAVRIAISNAIIIIINRWYVLCTWMIKTIYMLIVICVTFICSDLSLSNDRVPAGDQYLLSDSFTV